MALAPSPSVTPPDALICSAAAFMAASLLIPNTRTTPDLAPNPVILTVRSCANDGIGVRTQAVPNAASTAAVFRMKSSLDRLAFPRVQLFCTGAGWSRQMKLNTFPLPEYHHGKTSREGTMAKRNKRPARKVRAAGKSGKRASQAPAAKAATNRPATVKRQNGGLFANLKPNAANFAP